MRFHLLAVAAALVSLCSASVLVANPVERELAARATTPTPTPSAPLCAVKGARVVPTIFGSVQTSLTVPAQCGALCKSSSLCKSYAVDSTTCYLYILPVTKYVKKSATGPVTYYDVGCATATDLCWVSGKPKSGVTAMKSSTYFKDNSWTGCSDLCKATSGCKSYTLGTGACLLFSNTVAKNIAVDSSNPQSFWDVNCPLSAASLPAPPAGPSHDTSLTSQLNVKPIPPSFTSPPDFVPYTTNSPDLASMEQPPHGGFANDNDFTDSYNYTQFPLPTPTDLGSAPATTGFVAQATAAPSAPCMVSTGPQAQVSILNEDYIPLVSKASSQLGPVAQPTVSPAASNPLSQNPENMAFPLFYLQAPSGAPADTFDLIYAGSSTPQYVALQDNGKVVLRSASTGANFVGGFATTIFQKNCFGVLTVSQGGSSWIWATSGNVTKMTKGKPTRNFSILPKNLPAVVAARKNRARSVEMARKLLNRRDDQSGRAPRCPNTAGYPPNLVAHYKVGYEFDTGNLCDNLSDYWSLSPFDFDKSCAAQSLCYDLCETSSWEGCNTMFSSLMFISCAEHFKSWWDAIAGVACAAQAAYFTGVAATSQGRDVFYKAQKSMCGCFCKDGLGQCRSTSLSGGFDCVDLSQKDNNNCGACGRSCAPKTECKGNGNCGCIGDQCGGICLNLRNNPKNCGSCGHVCDSGYCVAGSCFTPSPEGCTPDPPIRDGDIYNSPEWDRAGVPADGCTFGTNVNVGASDLTIGSTVYKVASVTMKNMPDTGCSATLSQKQVKICPDIAYALTFNAFYPQGFTSNGVIIDNGQPCKVTWGLGPPTGTDFGQYQSQTFNIDTNAQNLKSYGPFTFTIAKGDAGVTKVGGNYFVNLWSVVTCTGAGNGAIRMNDVEINTA